jgi:hypothetical protein
MIKSEEKKVLCAFSFYGKIVELRQERLKNKLVTWRNSRFINKRKSSNVRA